METDSTQAVSPRKGRAEHLRPHWFKKGKSGNPGGRKRDAAGVIAARAFESDPEAALQGYKARLRKGDPRVFTALADRAYGRLAQPVALTGADGGGLVIEVRRIGGKRE